MNKIAVPNRDEQHGGLESVGVVSQRIKSTLREAPNWASLALNPAGREALDMIAHKVARILSCSDPHDFQHWEDIAGYAIAFMRAWSELHPKEENEKEASGGSFMGYDPDDYMASSCPDGFCPMPGVRQGPSEELFKPV